MAFPRVSGPTRTQLFSLFSETKQSQAGQSWWWGNTWVGGGGQGEACDPSWPSSSVWPLEACLTPTPENFTSWDFSGAPSLLWESGIYFNISNLIKMKVTLMFIHPGGTTVLTRVLKQSLPALQGHQPAAGSGGRGGHDIMIHCYPCLIFKNAETLGRNRTEANSQAFPSRCGTATPSLAFPVPFTR